MYTEYHTIYLCSVPCLILDCWRSNEIQIAYTLASSTTPYVCRLERSDNRATIGDVLDVVHRVFQFVASSILRIDEHPSNIELLTLLGDVFWPSFCRVLQQRVMGHCVPITIRQLQTFDQVRTRAQVFESDLTKLGLLRAKSASSDVLVTIPCKTFIVIFPTFLGL
jgi:hypothetical protein